jgi:hypothetical protein
MADGQEAELEEQEEEVEVEVMEQVVEVEEVQVVHIEFVPDSKVEEQRIDPLD